MADSNPLCGDKLEIGLQIEDGKIVDAMFSGEGCAISQASASMLLDEVIGKSLDEVKGLEKQFVYDMLGVPLTTNRVKCALLSFVIVQQAVDTFEL
ncbi:MAG: iron-sulfur cluster assembly scaffold protein [Candidatus Gracilibacteria bacterium]